MDKQLKNQNETGIAEHSDRASSQVSGEEVRQREVIPRLVEFRISLVVFALWLCFLFFVALRTSVE